MKKIRKKKPKRVNVENGTNEFIHVRNNEGRIVHTNYFDTPLARRGALYLTTNARTFRLLVPPALLEESRKEFRTAREVIISRGPVSGPLLDPRNALPLESGLVVPPSFEQCGSLGGIELLFEDDTACPFSFHMTTTQLDRVPPADESGRTDLRFIAYGPGLTVLADLPAKFRVVDRLPCLQSWKRMSGSPGAAGTDNCNSAEDKVIAEVLGSFNDRTKSYVPPLPDDIAKWYCYPPDAGHSILCVLKSGLREGLSHVGSTVPVPVKTVQKGYEIQDGFVVVDLYIPTSPVP